MKELKTYQKQIENRFSNLEYIEVSWLFNFSVVYFVNTLLTMILFLSSNFQLFPINIQLAFTIINSILVFSLYYMNYQGIRHYSIAHYQSQLPRPTTPAAVNESDTKQEIVNDKVISEKSSRIFERAKETMEAQKLFLEPNLRIKDLAIAMDENAHNLSESINSVGNKSFYDFVNGYRVEHLKMMLTDESKQGFTILALGLESGFNSKASLNRIFKQTTGLTPLQYQKASLHSV
jgi:AraC-like DNA-binding protein